MVEKEGADGFYVLHIAENITPFLPLLSRAHLSLIKKPQKWLGDVYIAMVSRMTHSFIIIYSSKMVQPETIRR